jgi:tetratricopeptide (TPR) repeat protein
VLNRARRLDEGNNEVCLLLAKVASFKQDYATAAQLLEQSIKQDKDQVVVIEQLAWLRSTCPDASIRNAQQALELTDRVRELTKENSAKLLVLKSAALAEAGRFDEAITAADEAEKLAKQSAPNSLEAKFGPLAAAIGAACRDGRSYQSARPLYASLADLSANQ